MLAYFNPITTKVTELDVRTQKKTRKSNTYSKDAQIVEVTATINYNLENSQAHLIFSEVGSDYENKLIFQVLEGTIKEVTGKYKAVEIISTRETVTTEIRDLLKARLGERRIVLTSLEINNLDFDDAFEQAVKDKVIAVERAKEAENKTVRIREEAEQQIISAKAEAESMRIRARALSQNRSLVEYEAVMKWNGKLPEYMLGNSVPFLNLGKKGQ